MQTVKRKLDRSKESNAIKCTALNSPDDQTPKRILVLGSVDHSRQVTAHAWDNLPNDLNVADYDVVIMNLMPFAVDIELAKRVDSRTLPSIEQFAQLLFSEGGEIVVIGHPGTRLSHPPSPKDASWWIPLYPFYTDLAGDQIRDVDPTFAYYLDHVEKCSFYWTGKFNAGAESAKQRFIRAIGANADGVEWNKIPIAQTRFHKAIAITASIVLTDHRKKPVSASCNIIWLPPTTRISHHEAVNLLLLNRYGVNPERTVPAWVAAYHLPKQAPIEEKISEHEREIERLQADLASARRDYIQETRFQRLLYEQGEPLELIVRDALRELGAVMGEFTEERREDGRLASPVDGTEGMLEVKGRRGTLKLSDVRQLDQWVRDALFTEEWEGKGILVANTFCDSPLEQRGDPFPDNCVRLAKQSGYCLVKTSQIFRALRDHQRGDLDVDRFWRSIFDANGVCALPDLEAESQQG